VQGGPCGKRGNWGRELNRVLLLREQELQNAVFCKESFCFRLTDHCPRILWLAKVRASSHEYPDVEEIKNLCEQNFKGHSMKLLQ